MHEIYLNEEYAPRNNVDFICKFVNLIFMSISFLFIIFHIATNLPCFFYTQFLTYDTQTVYKINDLVLDVDDNFIGIPIIPLKSARADFARAFKCVSCRNRESDL